MAVPTAEATTDAVQCLAPQGAASGQAIGVGPGRRLLVPAEAVPPVGVPSGVVRRVPDLRTAARLRPAAGAVAGVPGAAARRTAVAAPLPGPWPEGEVMKAETAEGQTVQVRPRGSGLLRLVPLWGLPAPLRARVVPELAGAPRLDAAPGLPPRRAVRGQVRGAETGPEPRHLRRPDARVEQMKLSGPLRGFEEAQVPAVLVVVPTPKPAPRVVRGHLGRPSTTTADPAAAKHGHVGVLGVLLPPHPARIGEARPLLVARVIRAPAR